MLHWLCVLACELAAPNTRFIISVSNKPVRLVCPPPATRWPIVAAFPEDTLLSFRQRRHRSDCVAEARFRHRGLLGHEFFVSIVLDIGYDTCNARFAVDETPSLVGRNDG